MTLSVDIVKKPDTQNILSNHTALEPLLLLKSSTLISVALFQHHMMDPNTLSHLLTISHDLPGHFALNLETKYTKSTKNSEVW